MPFKVCKNTAKEIRQNVKIILESQPKVPQEAVKHLRIAAETDDHYHRDNDPYFIVGNGPAVERQG